MEKKDLAIVVGDTVDMIRPEFEAKRIDIAVNYDNQNSMVLMEAPRFQRALLHILSLLAKFTSKNSKISISLNQKTSPESGHALFEVSVSDAETGLSKNLLTEKSGSAITLGATKRIMESLGGDVTVSSDSDQGLTYTLILPLKILDGVLDTLPAKTSLPKKTNKRRILLVEDIELSRELVETVLAESGFEVESVADGSVAVEAVAKKPEGYYSAILMDIQMPVMNGYEATRAIRALDRKDVFSLPIIALSANARMDDKVLSFESGMNEHVAKPFDAEGLIATLNKYLPDK